MTTNGYVGEPMSLGIARGGNVVSVESEEDEGSSYEFIASFQDFPLLFYGISGTEVIFGEQKDLRGILKNLYTSESDAVIINSLDLTVPRIPVVERGVGLFFEPKAAYVVDSDLSLEFEAEDAVPLGDLHVNTWTSEEETRGYVYQKVIQAVEEKFDNDDDDNG